MTGLLHGRASITISKRLADKLIYEEPILDVVMFDNGYSSFVICKSVPWPDNSTSPNYSLDQDLLINP